MKENLSKLFVFFLFIFMLGSANAQQVNIKGIVVDSSGEAIIGANVIVDGTSVGTITDANGNFSLSNVSSKGKLVVSYIGYVKQTVAIADESSAPVIE